MMPQFGIQLSASAEVPSIRKSSSFHPSRQMFLYYDARNFWASNGTFLVQIV